MRYKACIGNKNVFNIQAKEYSQFIEKTYNQKQQIPNTAVS